jgi:hypothetical protein
MAYQTFAMAGRTEAGVFVLYLVNTTLDGSGSSLLQYNTGSGAWRTIATTTGAKLFRGVVMPPQGGGGAAATPAPSTASSPSASPSRAATATATATQPATCGAASPPPCLVRVDGRCEADTATTFLPPVARLLAAHGSALGANATAPLLLYYYNPSGVAGTFRIARVNATGVPVAGGDVVNVTMASGYTAAVTGHPCGVGGGGGGGSSSGCYYYQLFAADGAGGWVDSSGSAMGTPSDGINACVLANGCNRVALCGSCGGGGR